LLSRLRDTIGVRRVDTVPLASTAVANAAIAACGLLSGALLARVLGADGRGELAAIQAWPLLLVAVGNFGLTEAAAYFAARAPGRARTALASALLLLAPFTALAIAIGLWLVPRVLNAQTIEVRNAAIISLSLVPLMALASAPYQALRGAGHIVAANALRLIAPAGWVVVLGGLALTGDVQPIDAALALIAVTAVSAIAAHAHAWRTLQGPTSPASSLARPMLAYGAPTVVSAVPQWLNLRLDQLVMIALLAPESVGLYAVAVAWGAAAQPIATVLAFGAVPGLAAASERHRQARLVYRSGAIVSAATSILLLAATPILLPFVFGDDFRAAVPAALLMVVAGALAGTNAVGGECLRGLGRPRALLAAECAGLAVTCVAVPILIPVAGILGAAAASISSYLAILLVQWRLIATAAAENVAEPGLVLALEAPPR
jgi:O-antigen/teichoic acid export membrane protein